MPDGIPTHSYDSLDSTNAEARRLIAAGRAERTFVVTARAQSAGRGRGANSWISPRDAGVYFSVVETDVGEIGDALTRLTLATGVACAEATEEVVGLRIRLQAINDLFIGTRKLGGILTESIVEGDQVRAIITGVGVNTRQAQRVLPDGLPEPISLAEALIEYAHDAHPDVIDEALLIRALAERIVGMHGRLFNGDWPAIRKRWEHYAGVDLDVALAERQRHES